MVTYVTRLLGGTYWRDPSVAVRKRLDLCHESRADDSQQDENDGNHHHHLEQRESDIAPGNCGFDFFFMIVRTTAFGVPTEQCFSRVNFLRVKLSQA